MECKLENWVEKHANYTKKVIKNLQKDKDFE